MFKQDVDMEARNAQGGAFLELLPDDISAIGDLVKLHTYLQNSLLTGVSGPFVVGVAPGLTDSTTYAAF